MVTSTNSRKLTISSIYQKQIFKKPIFKPKINLQGDWLEKAGFEIGEKISVSVSKNLLIIQKLEFYE